MAAFVYIDKVGREIFLDSSSNIACISAFFSSKSTLVS